MKFEDDNKALELRGSLVCDWKNKKIYCSLSQRSDSEVFEYLIDELNLISEKNTGHTLTGITFSSFDSSDRQIYHTDVMLAILGNHVVICGEMIKNEEQRESIYAELTDEELNEFPRTLITISEEECLNMCANITFAYDKNQNNCLIMSERAYVNYKRETKRILTQNYKVIKADLSVFEKIAGASSKSLLSEIK